MSARADDAEAALPLQAADRRTYGGAAPGPEQDVYELADVMDGFGIRSYHWKVLLLSWVLQLCPAAVVMTTPFVLKPIREEFDINRPTVALIGSAVTTGAVIGVLVFGPLHDQIGRKRANLLAVLGIGILAVMHLALPSHLEPLGQVEVRSFVCLVMLRFAIGIAFGGAAGYALLHFVEFLPARLRGLMMTLSSLGWSIGTLYSIMIASVFEKDWRVVLASPVLVCCLAFPLLLVGPESPRWLFTVGREQESRSVLGEIAASRRLLSPELPTRKLNSVPERVVLSHKVVDPDKDANLCSDMKTLFGPSLRRTTIVTMVIQVSVNGASYVNLIWMPEILTGLLGTRRVPYEMFVYSEVVSWVGTLWSAWAMDHWGRRPTLTICLVGTAVTMQALVMVPGTYNWILFVFLLQSAAGGGIWPAMQTYCAECFPTVLRGTGGSLCQGLGRTASVLLPIVVGALLDGQAREHGIAGDRKVSSAISFSALIWSLGALGALMIPLETANSKMADS
mmetsp:Transcript_19489/g.58461  ORF Transcript_19489/g.58461 Transcript_19489/m.58461 type:complete len:508 (+) Transcript_19489:155-1678(+)